MSEWVVPLASIRYDWTFEQNPDDFTYIGHIKKGKEIFVTFQFAPSTTYHELDS